ncbi:MAG: GNAT family N-acetyltransferase [Chloroflexota bacterium]
MEQLQGSRVVIRPWQRFDDDLANEWPPYNDPLDSLWNLPRQTSLTESWSTFFDSGQRRSWAVEDRSGNLIGRISLREHDPRRRQARLGITFGAPYVGRGLGTEALALFLDYYFTDAGYAVMVLDVAAPNERAVRCYRRLGFSYVDSDWREVGFSFDRRVLDMPPYEHLQRFFRPTARGLAVEFYEMRLTREEWFQRRRELSLPAANGTPGA